MSGTLFRVLRRCLGVTSGLLRYVEGYIGGFYLGMYRLCKGYIARAT